MRTLIDRFGPQVTRLIAPAVVMTASVVVAPIVAVLTSLLLPFGEIIGHVWGTLGTRYVVETLALTLTVGAFAGSAGTAAGLLVALCEFPFRRLFSFALVLPLAIPAYLSAYAYADLTGPFGWFAGPARMIGVEGFSIRSLPGAAFVLTLALFPYAYLTARSAFAGRSGALLDAARISGVGPVEAAFKLLVPASRPAIAAGVALIMMETIADFGVADYFGVATLSVGVFRTWYSFGDLTAASQLASALFLFALMLIVLETASRRGRSGDAPRGLRPQERFVLRGARAGAAFSFCAALVGLGFVIPAAVFLANGTTADWSQSSNGLANAFTNTGAVAAVGAALTLTVSVLLGYFSRSSRGLLGQTLIRIATLGYAIPGAVIAIGVLAVLSEARTLAGATITGVGALLFAYLVRFLTAGYNTTSAALAAIDPKVDEAASMLGATGGRILARIHLPLMRRSLVAAATILFVDIVKELPATLILREFNFETLATRVYRLASDERLAEASPSAIILIAISAVPIFMINAAADGAHSIQRKADSMRSQM